MAALPKPSAVVFAKDVARLAEFYAQTAGLTPLETGTAHVVLDGAMLQVVVHGIPPTIAARIEIAVPPLRREDTPIKLCLPVASLADARRAAALFGGQVDAPGQEWEARGFRACDGFDPEGNVVQFREAAGAS